MSPGLSQFDLMIVSCQILKSVVAVHSRQFNGLICSVTTVTSESLDSLRPFYGF